VETSAKGPLAESIELYLAHKRSLGKQLAKVGPMLSLLDGYLSGQGVAELDKITPAHIEGFATSRPRHSARSYKGLIGTLRGLFDWLVVHEVLPESPMRCQVRRTGTVRRPFLFEPEQARHLLEAAAQLPSNTPPTSHRMRSLPDCCIAGAAIFRWWRRTR
jgi:site-specific recombinase XerD